jgi:predicted DNA-binding transcriptional regulator AlpA
MNTTASIKLLTKKEVQNKLGICQRTLEYMVKQKRFPPGIRMGKYLKWAEVVVDKWLENTVRGQMEWKPKQNKTR